MNKAPDQIYIYNTWAASFHLAKNRNVENTLTLEEWTEIVQQHEFKCHYCRADLHAVGLTQDHVIPWSKGGTNVAANVVPACQRCNSHKHNMDYAEFKRRLIDPAPVNAFVSRLPAETIRQLDALCAKWDDSRSGAIQRTIERIYNLEIRDFENKDTTK